VVVLFAVAQNPAVAHPMPPDLTVVQIKLHYDGKGITCSVRGPASEMLTPADVSAANLKAEQTSKADLAKLTKQFDRQFNIEVEGRTLHPETASAADYDATNSGQYTLEVEYPTSKAPDKLRITSKFVHTIVSCNGSQFDIRGDKDPTADFDTKDSVGNVWRNVTDFIFMGMEHLFTGPDHILFICTLIFAVTNLWQAVKMLTGFTVGHAITLILSTFNVIHLDPRLADMGIALTITIVGIENILRKEMPTNRWALVTCFGLIHGMGFSSALKEVGLPQQGLVPCLLGFNVGLELAQVIIVACLFPVLTRYRWYKEAMDHVDGTKNYRLTMNYGSAVTACMGMYWFIDRFMAR